MTLNVKLKWDSITTPCSSRDLSMSIIYSLILFDFFETRVCFEWNQKILLHCLCIKKNKKKKRCSALLPRLWPTAPQPPPPIGHLEDLWHLFDVTAAPTNHFGLVALKSGKPRYLVQQAFFLISHCAVFNLTLLFQPLLTQAPIWWACITPAQHGKWIRLHSGLVFAHHSITRRLRWFVMTKQVREGSRRGRTPCVVS